MAVSIN